MYRVTRPFKYDGIQKNVGDILYIPVPRISKYLWKGFVEPVGTATEPDAETIATRDDEGYIKAGTVPWYGEVTPASFIDAADYDAWEIAKANEIADLIAYCTANTNTANTESLLEAMLFALYVGTRHTETQSYVKHTSEGGIAVRLTNKTGAASVKGTVIQIDSGDPESFVESGADSLAPAGAVYDDGIDDGDLCYVVVSGAAEVLLKDTEGCTQGGMLRTSDTAGRAIEAQAVAQATINITSNTAADPGVISVTATASGPYDGTEGNNWEVVFIDSSGTGGLAASVDVGNKEVIVDFDGDATATAAEVATVIDALTGFDSAIVSDGAYLFTAADDAAVLSAYLEGGTGPIPTVTADGETITVKDGQIGYVLVTDAGGTDVLVKTLLHIF